MKNKRKNAPKPPLTRLDKSIYYAGLFLAGILMIGVLPLCFDMLGRWVAFRDPEVAASTQHISAIFFLMPFILYTGASAFCVIESGLSDRVPIFGNRKIAYGHAPWAANIYPLTDARRKLLRVNPSQKQLRRFWTTVWAVGLLLCLLLTPLGFFGRDCLNRDGSITSFSALNRSYGEAYSGNDFSHLTIRTIRDVKSTFQKYRSYGILIEMNDGRRFFFSDRDFRGTGTEQTALSLESMAALKSRFPIECITIEGKSHVNDVAAALGLDAAEKEALLHLFEIGK